MYRYAFRSLNVQACYMNYEPDGMIVNCRHDEGQINVMFVGGPNQRKDFHIEAGEEVFQISDNYLQLYNNYQ